MNIRDLEYLIALSEFKHFRKAADFCHVSQPTLSGQIRKLENELGTILLERTSRKVLFTQSGLMLVNQAKVILREVKVFKDMASNQGKEMSGPLHIGIIPTLAPYLVPMILPTLYKYFPELELYLYELQTSELVQQLEAGQLDCGLLSFCEESAPFIEVPIFKEKIQLAVSNKHRWANLTEIDLSDLTEKDILLLEDGHCLRDKALSYCLSVGGKEDKHFKAKSLETLKNMVAANMGITLVPELAMQKKVDSQIHYISFKDPKPCRDIGLIYRPGSPLRVRYERLAAEIKKIMETNKPL